MESQVARRRVNMIAAHFAANHDISAIATHVFPMNCSSSLNSVIRRHDSRMNFARQGSSSQACFMRQVSTEQDISGHSGVTFKCTGSENEGSSIAFEAPLFSRPASIVKDCKLPAYEPPRFAQPNRGISGKNMFCSKKKMHAFESYEWSPRMDVAESGCNYNLVVELPGVSTRDIRIEVNDKSLTVKGNRSSQLGKMTSCSDDSISAYHKREILQGPYQVVWPLPTNVNKDSVSAEFVDGLLRITVPKL